MTDADWSEPFARAVAAAPPTNAFVLLINAWWEPLTFILPEQLHGISWSAVVDTADGSGPPAEVPTNEVVVGGRSLLMLGNQAGGAP